MRHCFGGGSRAACEGGGADPTFCFRHPGTDGLGGWWSRVLLVHTSHLL